MPLGLRKGWWWWRRRRRGSSGSSLPGSCSAFDALEVNDGELAAGGAPDEIGGAHGRHASEGGLSEGGEGGDGDEDFVGDSGVALFVLIVELRGGECSSSSGMGSEESLSSSSSLLSSSPTNAPI